VGGHRRISILEIARLTNQQEKTETQEREVAIYCRVSSTDQKKKGDLARQVQAAQEHCYQQGYPKPHVFQDIGSGLKADRRDLKKLCRLIEQGKVARVILTYPDRLTRVGFDYLSNYFLSHGTDIQVINEPERIGKRSRRRQKKRQSENSKRSKNICRKRHKESKLNLSLPQAEKKESNNYKTGNLCLSLKWKEMSGFKSKKHSLKTERDTKENQKSGKRKSVSGRSLKV